MEGHAKDLRAEVDDSALTQAIKTDWRTASLDDPTRALLTYAEKLTLSPGEMTQSDVDLLRAQNFTDRDITDAAHNIAFFSYINRMGEGLGVELEPFMEDGGESTAPKEAPR